MINGRGYQALGPLCALAPDYCGASFGRSAQGLPAVRGPPLPSERRISQQTGTAPSGLKLLPDMTLGQAVGPR